ncbi:MAG: hypothetical protein JSV51_08250 [Candidatus Bathyarchaeota archaeon]|nr:MAG: hypothetical protein JSV51_08250 [Candidatus Bathyarchaeota archaeon]
MPQHSVESKKRNIRVKTWEDFKRLAIKEKPKSIVYIIAQSIPASNLTSLKLILPTVGTQYIFIDTAKNDKLRQTQIQIHSDGKGHRFLEDNDIKAFLKRELQRKDLQIFSYWTA